MENSLEFSSVVLPTLSVPLILTTDIANKLQQVRHFMHTYFLPIPIIPYTTPLAKMRPQPNSIETPQQSRNVTSDDLQPVTIR